ncbi:MAG: PLAT/LH2 domain-containing protein [Bacillota bacterium]
MTSTWRKLISCLLITILVIPIISTNVTAWSSYTHNQTFHKSKHMLEDLMAKDTQNAFFTPEFKDFAAAMISEMMQYEQLINDATDDPDDLGNDVTRELWGTGQFWSSHYMDPYTEKTYSGKWYAPNFERHEDITAGYMAKRYVDYAAGQWLAGNKGYATYLLAYACHFIADATNPHHASLDISTEDADAISDWIPDFTQSTTHGEHEGWANSRYDYFYNNYNIGTYDVGYTTGTPVENRAAFEAVLAESHTKTLSDFVYDRMIHYGKQVYGKGDDLVQLDCEILDITPEQMAQLKGQTYVDLAYRGTVQVPVGGTTGGYQEYVTKYMYLTEAELPDWIDSAVAGFDASVELFAEVLYRFIYEIRQVQQNENLLRIEIDTDTEYYSASDDTFYLRFNTTDGRYDEMFLDNLYLAYDELKDLDDFETGTTSTFYMSIADPSFINSVSSFSLRHEDVFFNDGWKPRAIRIYRNDVLVHEQAINQWFENNNIRTYVLPNGLNYPTQPSLGQVNIQVLTGHGTHELTDEGGTSDEVYLGIRNTDGLVHEIFLGNYFTENSVNSRLRTIDNPHFNWNNIHTMYLRKVNHDLPAGSTVDPEDAWKVEGLVLKADTDGDGQMEALHAKDFGSFWLADNDNAQYEWNASIDTTKEYMGMMEAEVGVLDVDDAEANANVYLDIEFMDGTTTNYILDTRDDDFGRNSTRSYYKVLPILKKDIRKLQLRLASGDELGLKSFMYKHYFSDVIYSKETFYDFIDTQNPKHDFLVPSAATGSGLGTFKVNVRTAAADDSNTDDEVYMGIVFNNKDTLMLPLATGATNLAKGQYLSKQFTVSNPNFKWEDVTKIFFRKRDTTLIGDDAWKLDAYTITRNGKNISGMQYNVWIGDSYEAFYNIPVYYGIDVNRNIVGFIKTIVAVGSTADKSGTSGDLRLELGTSNNGWWPLIIQNPNGFQSGSTVTTYAFLAQEIYNFNKVKLSLVDTSDEEFELKSLSVDFMDGNNDNMSQIFNEWITKTNTYAQMDGSRTYTPIGGFYAYIQTDIADDSDTDDDIYIGFEFNNGDRYEKYLDLSGDDFERYSFDYYSVNIANNDYDWSQLKDIYFVKRRGSNAWKVSGMSIVDGGKTIYACYENKWVNSNNTRFISSGTALNPNANLIGFVTAVVKTKDGGMFDFYGTDDDVYMGLKVNGSWRYRQLDSLANDFEEGNMNIFHAIYPYSVGTTDISMKKMSGGDDWYLEYVELSFPGRSWGYHKYTFNKEYTSDNAQEFTLPVSSTAPF